ncbi:dipeptidase PepV [Fructilactobacillus vespulae]|uniref:dipeptidase PepV n=1 Tax=Fructilactobacillus vespulae TaxID=1249630 RepID=UPI0039B5EA2F
MISWKDEANKYKQDYLNDLKELVAIDSSRDVEHATSDYPLGAGPAKALAIFLKFAKRDGFTTKNIENIVGYVEYGEGDEYLAILGHADTVPAGKGWDTDPFTLMLDEGKAIGRGTSDDKGPALAAYYGLKMLKENGIKPNLKIRLIIGTDEESNWTGMKRYFEVEPEPKLGFSPDAEFPLINGEKGNVTFETKFKGINKESENTLINFKAGLKENMVPRDAEAVVKTNNVAELTSAFDKFVADMPITGEISDADGMVTLSVVGKAAHGMEPKNGVNAGTYLAKFLSNYDFDESGHDFIAFVADKLHLDSRAHSLGLNFTDEIMGDLTMNIGIMEYSKSTGGLINTNFRYPKGIDPEKIKQQLIANADKYHGVVSMDDGGMKPHFVDPDDDFIKTLMAIYSEQTGQLDAKPEVVGGGTYGRMMKRGVAFGALLPGAADTMHQANEFQVVDDLMLAMSIYGQSIYELTK